MVGRAGFRTGKVPTGSLAVDDLTADQDAAADEAERAGSAPDPDDGASDRPARP
jgi:multicomponent Na+:H+ antiporter subunit G